MNELRPHVTYAGGAETPWIWRLLVLALALLAIGVAGDALREVRWLESTLRSEPQAAYRYEVEDVVTQDNARHAHILERMEQHDEALKAMLDLVRVCEARRGNELPRLDTTPLAPYVGGEQ